MGVYISAILAGLLTSFSPCVISALPFVISSSFSENKKGPLFLVGGLITSFVLLGVLFGLSTKVFGLEQETLKHATAVVFILIGLVFLFSQLGNYLSALVSPIANSSNNLANRIDLKGSFGQFLLGFLFGIIWSPCSGPTLGYALTLVAKENNIPFGALIMFIYGLSASLPLLFVAYVSKSFIQKNMGKVNSVYYFVKKAMGIFLILLGVLTLSGLDKVIEAFIIRNIPEFLLDLITKF